MSTNTLRDEILFSVRIDGNTQNKVTEKNKIQLKTKWKTFVHCTHTVGERHRATFFTNWIQFKTETHCLFREQVFFYFSLSSSSSPSIWMNERKTEFAKKRCDLPSQCVLWAVNCICNCKMHRHTHTAIYIVVEIYDLPVICNFKNKKKNIKKLEEKSKNERMGIDKAKMSHLFKRLTIAAVVSPFVFFLLCFIGVKQRGERVEHEKGRRNWAPNKTENSKHREVKWTTTIHLFKYVIYSQFHPYDPSLSVSRLQTQTHRKRGEREREKASQTYIYKWGWDTIHTIQMRWASEIYDFQTMCKV